MEYQMDKSGKLTIVVDCSDSKIKDAPTSKSGKSKLVASTNGFVGVNGKGRLSLNVITA